MKQKLIFKLIYVLKNQGSIPDGRYLFPCHHMQTDSDTHSDSRSVARGGGGWDIRPRLKLTIRLHLLPKCCTTS
jgi:hypothetical protein